MASHWMTIFYDGHWWVFKGGALLDHWTDKFSINGSEETALRLAALLNDSRFPIAQCKKCGKPVNDDKRDGKTILFCSYECYALD